MVLSVCLIRFNMLHQLRRVTLQWVSDVDEVPSPTLSLQEVRRPDEGAIGVVEWAQALAEGTEAVKRYGGATLGCRTMLDALAPAAAACLQAATRG
jgi:hypothetical protein